MSRSDEVFAMFADANPVPVVAALEDRLDHLPVDLEGGSDMTNITELGSNRSDDAAGRSRRRGSGPRYLVAAAALVFGLIGGVWFLAEDRPIDLADPGVPIEERALAAVERHYAAVESGDIETVVALAGSEDVADARMWEFNSVLAKAGYPTIVEQCEATRGSDVLAYVRCTVTMDHPVFEAIGDTEAFATCTGSETNHKSRPWRPKTVKRLTRGKASP